jgi:hypothetical protein
MLGGDVAQANFIFVNRTATFGGLSLKGGLIMVALKRCNPWLTPWQPLRGEREQQVC